LPANNVEKIIVEHTKPRTLGFLGEPTVNVLAVNLALDALAATGGAVP
jgi:K+-transporting ATPase ATPase C chain